MLGCIHAMQSQHCSPLYEGKGRGHLKAFSLTYDARIAHLIADVNVADGQLQVANDGVNKASEHATAAALAILLGLWDR